MINKQELLDFLLELMEKASFITFPVIKELYVYVKHMDEVAENE